MISVIGNCRIAVYIRQMWQEREAARIEEQIEMEVISTPATRLQVEVIKPAEDDRTDQLSIIVLFQRLIFTKYY